jgi:hypothetical protein
LQVLDAKPGIVSSGIIRAADLHQYDVDRQPAAGDEPRNIGNIGRHNIVGAPGKKPPSGAGAAQGGSLVSGHPRTSANIGASLMPAGGGCLVIHFVISRSPPAHAAAGSDCALQLGIAAGT